MGHTLTRDACRTIKFTVMKDGMSKLNMKSPLYIPGPVQPNFGPGRFLYFEGFSVDEHGKQHFLDATIAYRQTTLRVIEYLRRFGYNDYQVYLLLSCAPVEGHIAGLVDVSANFLSCSFVLLVTHTFYQIPNACTTLGLPMDIFDFDIRPEAEVVKRDLGSCAFVSKK